MKNKCCLLAILVVFLIGLIACSYENKPTTLNLTFSEYYQKADDYEKIYPLLNEYFYCIQNACDNSD